MFRESGQSSIRRQPQIVTFKQSESKLRRSQCVCVCVRATCAAVWVCVPGLLVDVES